MEYMEVVHQNTCKINFERNRLEGETLTELRGAYHAVFVQYCQYLKTVFADYFIIPARRCVDVICRVVQKIVTYFCTP